MPACGLGIVVLDIGVGASCIYCIVGIHEYGWKMIGCNITAQASASARCIIDKNALASQIEFRRQRDAGCELRGMLRPNETIAFCLCNPSFYESLDFAQRAASAKASAGGLTARPRIIRARRLNCDAGEVKLHFQRVSLLKVPRLASAMRACGSLPCCRENHQSCQSGRNSVSCTPRAEASSCGREVQ